MSLVQRSKFKITGNENLFRMTIVDNKKLIYSIIFVIAIFITYVLTTTESKILSYSVLLIILFWTCVFLFYLDLKKDITINVKKRVISIRQEPLINITHKQPIVVDFYDVKGFHVKNISMTRNGNITSYIKSGLNTHYSIVYINFKNRSLRLIDLNNGPYYFVDHELFVKCLAKIIK